MAAKAKLLGKANVFIDGTYQGLVDLYSKSPTYKSSVFSVSDLTPGTHTVKIEVSGKKNASATGYNVDIDALKVGS